MEDLNTKYVPTNIFCAWAVCSDDKQVEFLGQVPRELDEENMDLPEWVYATRDYGNGKEERIYKVRTGSLEEFMRMWLAGKLGKASFSIANLEVY